jgi:hypothetical protein
MPKTVAIVPKQQKDFPTVFLNEVNDPGSSGP